MLILNFNSCSPHGERSLCVYDTLVHTGISILASFMGSDLANFLYDSQHSISIHVPHMESDGKAVIPMIVYNYFNSRSPHGDRLDKMVLLRFALKFQFPFLALGATSF